MTAHLSVDVVLLLAAFSRNLSLRGRLMDSECIVIGKENQKATHHVQKLALCRQPARTKHSFMF